MADAPPKAHAAAGKAYPSNPNLRSSFLRGWLHRHERANGGNPYADRPANGFMTAHLRAWDAGYKAHLESYPRHNLRHDVAADRAPRE